ncbi:MAG: MBL fold metallo-hydrolase [Bacteroidaceae bacterium]|nr:MBL fold metallo-hydrolase [Bacteroidaceae bacterium]
MLQFRCIGSSSKGNCYLIRNSEGCILVDAGVGIRRIRKYLYESGVALESLKAIFLTHDHVDHAKNVGTIQHMAARKGQFIKLYATEKVLASVHSNPAIKVKPSSEGMQLISYDEMVRCCGCEITPFSVPHDSADNVGYFISEGEHTLCLVTDVGQMTDTIHQYIDRTDQLILESNYDEKMLRDGPYPYHLKKRISGGNGHLSNVEAATVIWQHREKLQRVWLCHLSENNNTPESAMGTVEEQFLENGLLLRDFVDVKVLHRTLPSPLFFL